MNKTIYKGTFFGALILTFTGAAGAQVAINPPYALEQTVVAGGGGTSADAAGNVYSITGAIGQAVTDASGNSPFTLRSGFFTAAPAPLAPTAAMVAVGGRVLTASGRGIRNAVVLMTDQSGTIRAARTTAFGRFRFTDVAAGETYIFTVKGKRFDFAQPTQVLNVGNDVDDINFTAAPR